MLSDNVISGEVSQAEEPDWEPLRQLVGMELADWFMWMFEIELDDGTIVHAYKHIATRGYFHIGMDRRVFVYRTGGFYEEYDPVRAIDLVFMEWERYLTERHDPVAIRRQLDRARKAASARVSRQTVRDDVRDDRTAGG